MNYKICKLFKSLDEFVTSDILVSPVSEKHDVNQDKTPYSFDICFFEKLNGKIININGDNLYENDNNRSSK